MVIQCKSIFYILQILQLIWHGKMKKKQEHIQIMCNSVPLKPIIPSNTGITTVTAPEYIEVRQKGSDILKDKVPAK